MQVKGPIAVDQQMHVAAETAELCAQQCCDMTGFGFKCDAAIFVAAEKVGVQFTIIKCCEFLIKYVVTNSEKSICYSWIVRAN